jgi:Ferritin-like domain
VTELGHSRREALRRGAFAAGALAAGGMLRPALAAAASSTADDDLRDFLVEAIGLEQVTVLAYATASDQADPGARQMLQDYRDQEQAHASAWRSALDSIGFDAPDAPDAPDDTGVFDSVDGLSDESATELKDLLTKIGDTNGGDQFLELLADLEKRQIAYYVAEAPGLDSYDLATTSAEISNCQAAHLVVLHEDLGDSPADAASAVSDAIASASGSAPPAGDSDTGSSTTSTTTTDSTSTTTTSSDSGASG